MKRFVMLLALVGCATPQVKTGVEAPSAMHTQGTPDLPKRIVERLRPYQNARSAAFLDWTPDGSKLLIATRFANTSQLHLVHGPGGRREQITFLDEPVGAGFYLGDGSLVYASARGGDENYQLYRMMPDRKITLLTDGKSRNQFGPRAHDGKRFTFTSNKRNGRDTDVFLWEDGAISPLMEVTNEFWHVADWSPDDSKLLLERYVSVNESYPFVMDLKTRERKAVPIPGGKAACGPMRFAPDGTSLLMACDANHEFRTLALVNLTTFEFTWITEDIPWDVDELEVKGDRVAFTVNADGISKLFFLSLAPWKRTPVELPMGVASRLTFKGGKLAMALDRPDAPEDVYVLDDRDLVRWTFSEVGPLDTSTFVLPKRIAFASFDGRDIAAYYYAGKTTKAPVIIDIHGGPEAQFTPTFSAMIQFYVRELGCAVIAPNVRGSLGYGKTFTMLDDGFKREDAVRDVGALLDWISKQPELDASRVAVIGGSYGGYVVLGSLVMFGNRLKAGVDIVGISNFVTFLENTSAYRRDLRRVEYGDERDPKMRAHLQAISPANHVDKIRSALLVAHGKNDPRVPVGEAEQIFRGARNAGLPAWLVIADNEGHGYAKKENRDYLSSLIVLFFENHLLQ